MRSRKRLTLTVILILISLVWLSHYGQTQRPPFGSQPIKTIEFASGNFFTSNYRLMQNEPKIHFVDRNWEDVTATKNIRNLYRSIYEFVLCMWDDLEFFLNLFNSFMILFLASFWLHISFFMNMICYFHNKLNVSSQTLQL